MYRFRPVTERMKVMHERTRERIFQVDSERATIITEANKKYENVVPTIRNALIFKAMCEEMTPRVEDHEILVANNTKYFCGTRLDPRWGGGDMYVKLADEGIWKLGDDGMYHNPEPDELRLVMSPEDMERLRAVGAYWRGRTIDAMANAWQPEGYDELNHLGWRSFGENMPIVMMPAGHSTPGIRSPLHRLRGSAAAGPGLDRRPPEQSHGRGSGEKPFYSAVEIVCDGAITLLKRYGQVCYDAAARCADAARTRNCGRWGQPDLDLRKPGANLLAGLPGDPALRDDDRHVRRHGYRLLRPV
jgi:formate C-acetyltransferase